MNPLVPLSEEVELPATLPNAVPVALRKLGPWPCGESQPVMVSSLRMLPQAVMALTVDPLDSRQIGYG